MTFALTLPHEIVDELHEAARERHCSPRCFALETLHAALAKVPVSGREHAAQMTGTRGAGRVVEEEVELEGYPVHCQITEGEL